MEQGKKFMDCLQVIEVKAAIYLLRLYQNNGAPLSFMGNIDGRCLYNNDKAEIDRELEPKIQVVRASSATFCTATIPPPAKSSMMCTSTSWTRDWN